MLKPGDKFVRFSKYGHVFGIVESINYDSSITCEHSFSYYNPTLRSTVGTVYDLNECFKVRKIYTPEESEKQKLLFERLRKIKENHGRLNTPSPPANH